MEQTPLAKKLSALGLDKKEAETYIALLKLGPSPVQKIAKETGLNRSSLYVVLDRLQKQGLVSTAAEKGVRRYVAVSPERLERIAKERLEQAALTRQNLETLLPEIQALTTISRHRPNVEVHTGAEGLRLGFDDGLNTQEKVMRVASCAGKIAQSLPDYLPLFVQKRFKRGIRMLGIHPDDEAGREMIRRVPKTIDTLVFLPEDKFHLESDLGIYDDKIAFMSHEQLLYVSVQSRALADVMKVVFDLAQVEGRHIGRDPYEDHG